MSPSRSARGNTGQRMGGIAGTIAESKFEELYPHKWLRMGFDRPSWSDNTQVGYALPKVLTAMPDYLARNGEGPYWVECVGCKGNLVRSIKVEKFNLLRQWEFFTGLVVHIFVWNSSKRKWLCVSAPKLEAWIDEYAPPVKAFHDGPLYYELQWDELAEIARWTGRAG